MAGRTKVRKSQGKCDFMLKCWDHQNGTLLSPGFIVLYKAHSCHILKCVDFVRELVLFLYFLTHISRFKVLCQ